MAPFKTPKIQSDFFEIPKIQFDFFEIPKIQSDCIRGKFGLKTAIIPIGGTSMKLTSDVYDNVIRNTAIEINPGFLCTVKGENVNIFIDKIKDIIKEYSI